jgi:hypothetical protein
MWHKNASEVAQWRTRVNVEIEALRATALRKEVRVTR